MIRQPPLPKFWGAREVVSEHLADDFSQRGGVTGEGAAALDGGEDFGSRLLALKEFSDLNVACALQFFEVRSEVSIGSEEASQGREGERWGRVGWVSERD